MLKNAKHFAVFGAIAVFSGWAQGQSLIPAPSGVSGYGAPAAQGGYSGPFYSQMGGPQATVPVAPAMAPMPSSLPISAPVPSHHAPMQAGNLGAAAPMAPTANSAGHAVTQAVNVSARGSGSVMQASAGVSGAAPSWVQKVSGTVIEGGYSTMGESLWSDSCDGIAGDCGIQTCESACSHPLWTHFTGVHASLLYLRPRNTDIAYGVPVDGPIIGGPNNNPIQVGSVGVVDFDYDLGFDVGVNFAVTPMTSVFADLMMFDTSTSSSISTTPPNVIRSLVSHPSSTSAATDFLSASADLDMSLDVVDVGIRHLFVGGDYYAVNYIVGARYARWEENFNATFQDNGSEDVSTSIDFDGAGVRLGLEAERQSCHSRLRIYSRASSSFLAGHFTGNYFQGQTFDPSVVSTDWEVGRVVPVLDLEAGAGWTSAGGGVRLSAGYLFSAWFNTVQSEEFIHAVQQNNFIDLGNTMTLDGLRATAELRF